MQSASACATEGRPTGLQCAANETPGGVRCASREQPPLAELEPLTEAPEHPEHVRDGDTEYTCTHRVQPVRPWHRARCR